MVAVFVAVYFAVAIGGGDGALTRVLSETPLSGEALASIFGTANARLTLTVAEALALAAASAAILDAAWRPARRWSDGLVSAAVALAAIVAALARPEAATPAYAVIAALAIGDAGAALWRRRAT